MDQFFYLLPTTHFVLTDALYRDRAQTLRREAGNGGGAKYLLVLRLLWGLGSLQGLQDDCIIYLPYISVGGLGDGRLYLRFVLVFSTGRRLGLN